MQRAAFAPPPLSVLWSLDSGVVEYAAARLLVAGDKGIFRQNNAPIRVTRFCQRVCHEPAAAHIGDRKSTRLNSSHSQISYAVFCLKKKKTNREPIPMT